MLVPLVLTAGADAGIHKKMLGSRASGSGTITLIISNKKVRDIRKIVKSLKVLVFW